MKNYFILFLCFVLNATPILCQTFDFNAACISAYNDIIALKLESGIKKISIEKKINPSNQIPILLENYVDFLTVYTSGSLSEYELVKGKMEQRVGELKNSQNESAYTLYSQAELHIQSAVLHIKFGEYVACIFDIKKALKKLEKNQQQFPDFMPNNKSLGMLYAILGSIPQEYQGALSFLGLKREVSKGMALLKKASYDTSHPFQHESATIYAFMQLHIQNNAVKAWQVLESLNFSPASNVMDAYTLGHIGIYGFQTDKGIQALQKAPKTENYHAFPLINYMLGIGKTYRQDKDANDYFSLFLKQNKGADYVKSAYQKIAWNYLISNNIDQYKANLNKIKTNGRAVLDADKQAEKEADNNYTPNPILLKARLQTDGNYLSKAAKILEEINVNSFTNLNDKTEYFYRLARIYDKGNQTQKAIDYYLLTIKNGQNIPFYYAANSAYLLAYLYEQKKEKDKAVSYYNLCLKLNGYEYENSIHQKAEAGLNRLE